MKVLVTGGAGFIGSHIVDLLLDEGHDVAVIDDLSTGRRENVPDGVQFAQLDICWPQTIQYLAQFRPEVICHHAAQMDARKSIVDPIKDTRSNVLGVVNLLEAGSRLGLRKFIHISTGGPLYGEPSYLPFDEVHPVHPVCQYGLSKWVGEQYCRLYGDLYKMEWVAFRYPNVYGPRQRTDGEAGVVAIFAGRMLNGQPVTIYGEGEQTRDFVAVADIARANLLALDKGRGVICLGRGVGTKVIDIYRRLSELTGYKGTLIYAAPRFGEVNETAMSFSKAETELGWQPLVELFDGLTDVVESLRE
jgi:UDP-glucose 4-epimerase